MPAFQEVERLQQCLRDAQARMMDMGRVLQALRQQQSGPITEAVSELDRLCRDAGQKLQQAQIACERVF